MIINTGLVLKNARANANKNALAGGTISVYTEPMPSNGAALTGQTLLAEFTLPSPVGTVDNGAFDVGGVLETIALENGAGAWARILDGVDSWLMDVDVGATGSGAAIIADPINFYMGGTVRINTFRLVEP